MSGAVIGALLTEPHRQRSRLKQPRRWFVVTLDDAGEDGTVLYACYTQSGKLRGVAHTLGPIRADAQRHGASLQLRGSQVSP